MAERFKVVSVCRRGVAISAMVIALGACGGSDGETTPEARDREETIEAAKRQYPRIPAGDIRLPSNSDLRNPDFDVGGHCLAEEKAGRGSFEQCLEVVGRELIAIGGPDQR